MGNETTIAAEPRKVTKEEIDFITENGWAHLKGFIDPEIAAGLLATGKELMAKGKDQDAMKESNLHEWWSTRRRVALDDKAEPYRSVLFSPNLGKAAHDLQNRARLTDRDISVRLASETLTCKAPNGQPGNEATPYHQDWPGSPYDRRGSINLWIALDDVPAERGSMRFLSGSHREGPLGRIGRGKFDDIRDEYPKLTELYEWSPPLDMKAGDATVHDGCTVHGGPANTTDEHRWAWIMQLFPDDAIYNGAQSFVVDGLDQQPNQYFDSARLPVLYPHAD